MILTRREAVDILLDVQARVGRSLQRVGHKVDAQYFTMIIQDLIDQAQTSKIEHDYRHLTMMIIDHLTQGFITSKTKFIPGLLQFEQLPTPLGGAQTMAIARLIPPGPYLIIPQDKKDLVEIGFFRTVPFDCHKVEAFEYNFRKGVWLGYAIFALVGDKPSLVAYHFDCAG